MLCAFVDPEPPSENGGGIRTYILAAQSLLREAGWQCLVFSHNPGAYAPQARPIGRTPFLPRRLRGLAYRLAYHQVVLWEQSRWLEQELLDLAGPNGIYEFADFAGYAFFPLRNPVLRDRCVVRAHTPGFLIPASRAGPRAALEAGLAAWREIRCLRRARHVTAPSAAFMREKLPFVREFRYLLNPSPRQRPLRALPDLERVALSPRYLYLGRLEPRKGVHVLLEAFSRLLAERPEAGLTIAGDAPDPVYAGHLEGMLSGWPHPSRERVRWLPAHSRQGVDGLFLEHHFLVVPSLWENSPYVFFEGMAAWLWCLGTDTGEMGDVLRGLGGPVARPGDAASLADAMAQAAAGARTYGTRVREQALCLEERRSRAARELADFFRESAAGGRNCA